MLRNVARSMTVLVLACSWLFATMQPAQALAAKGHHLTATTAPAKHKRHRAKEVITGKVLSHGTAVAGARVHFRHHHKHHTTTTSSTHVKTHGKTNAKTHAATAPRHRHHHGVLSKADGTFTLHARHIRVHHLVAHKKGVGRGHVTVQVKDARNVVIKLHHKHHHSHGTTVTTSHKRSHKSGHSHKSSNPVTPAVQ